LALYCLVPGKEINIVVCKNFPLKGGEEKGGEREQEERESRRRERAGGEGPQTKGQEKGEEECNPWGRFGEFSSRLGRGRGEKAG
jgi:hypothetical protein